MLARLKVRGRPTCLDLLELGRCLKCCCDVAGVRDFTSDSGKENRISQSCCNLDYITGLKNVQGKRYKSPFVLTHFCSRINSNLVIRICICHSAKTQHLISTSRQLLGVHVHTCTGTILCRKTQRFRYAQILTFPLMMVFQTFQIK